MLIVEDLRFSYRLEGPFVLCGLDLQVGPGEVVGILGGNGAGKTTLFACLAGFLRPQVRKLELDGVDLLERPEVARQQIAYLPEAVALWDSLTAGEHLEIFAALQASRKDLRQQLETWGLPVTTWSQKVRSFSKGMRQKLALAIVTLAERRLLLLDEPTSGLDPASQRELLARIEDLAKQGAGVIVVTHDVVRLPAICHRRFLLSEGQLRPWELPQGFGGPAAVGARA